MLRNPLPPGYVTGNIRFFNIRKIRFRLVTLNIPKDYIHKAISLK